MIIEQLDNSTIRSKTKYNRLILRPSQVFSTAIEHPCFVSEAFAPYQQKWQVISAVSIIKVFLFLLRTKVFKAYTYRCGTFFYIDIAHFRAFVNDAIE
ncbi:MAG: hypothetical protein DRP62_01315 [Planctomycetota bacterium]|nr:MAG: hypothetical protein DRP62_01315 [Planctomycetota bacterium]